MHNGNLGSENTATITQPKHVSPPHTPTSLSGSVSQATSAHEDSALTTVSASTPLLSSSQTSSQRPAPSHRASLRRAAAFGLTIGVVEFASSYDGRLSYITARAVGWSLFYSALSYSTGNSSTLMAMTALFQAAVNLYWSPQNSFAASVNTIFRNGFVAGVTQRAWNYILPEDEKSPAEQVNRYVRH
jgi:hypothetical protein